MIPQPGPTQAPLWTVVLNWNGREDTLRCLASLEAQEGARCLPIVIDNGSTDGSVAAVRSAFPSVELVENGENLGYAEGNNVGLRFALDRGADHVLVLNNDTVLAPDCLHRLLCEADRHPEAGAIGPKVFDGFGSRTLYACGGSFDWKGQPRMTGYGEPDEGRDSESRETGWINGCAILFSRQALLAVGLFEPRYFLLFEETDWCVRAARQGFSLRVAPSARVWHRGSASFGSLRSPQYLYYYTRNHLLWVERTASRCQKPARYWGALRRAYKAMRSARHADPESGRSMRRAVARGLGDYCRRRFGRCDAIRATPPGAAALEGPDHVARGFATETVDPLRYGSYPDDPHEAPGMIARMVPQGSRVLDVGCGVGTTMLLVREHRRARVAGLEPHWERARRARDRGLEVYSCELTRETARGLGRFDAVLFVDVLEHLADPAAALDLARDLLAPGGRVLAAVPNVAHWSVRLSLLFGRFAYGPQGIMDATHLRWFTEAGVRRLFEACGFELKELRVTAGVAGVEYKRIAPWRWLTKRQRGPLIRWAARRLPRLFGYQFVVAAAAAESAASAHS